MNELPAPKLVTGYVAYLAKDKSFYGKYNRLSEFKTAAISDKKNPDDFIVMKILGSGQNAEKKSIFLSDFAFRNKVDVNVNGFILEQYKWAWEPQLLLGELTESGIEFELPKKKSSFNYYLYKVSLWISNLFKFL